MVRAVENDDLHINPIRNDLVRRDSKNEPRRKTHWEIIKSKIKEERRDKTTMKEGSFSLRILLLSTDFVFY